MHYNILHEHILSVDQFLQGGSRDWAVLYIMQKIVPEELEENTQIELQQLNNPTEVNAWAI